MDGPAVRNPRRGGVLDGFWPSPYARCSEEMSTSSPSDGKKSHMPIPNNPDLYT
jgi:hypothetical protein